MLTASLLLLAAALPVSIAGANLALGLATAALLLRFAVPGGSRPAWPRDAVAVCLWIYLAVGIAAAISGVSPRASLTPLQKDAHKLWAFYLLSLAFTAAPVRRLHWPMALGFMVIACAGIFQSAHCVFAQWMHPVMNWTMIRASGFVHPVTFGGLLAFALLGNICFLALDDAGPLVRRLAWAFFGLVLAALLLSQTRAAFLGVGAGFIAMCIAEPKLRRWLKYALAAAILGALVLELLPTHRSLISSIHEYGASAASNSQMARLALWKTAWRMFCDHPWLGVGPGNYATLFTDYYQGVIDGQRTWGSAHNIFLHQLAERGILGFTALLALWTTLFRCAWQRWQAAKGAWSLFALSATAAFLVMNLTENAFQNEQVATLFLLIWTRAQYSAPEPSIEVKTP
ncbi:MAG: O-antigen ligase family protein [Elusimicrobiota bacterium]